MASRRKFLVGVDGSKHSKRCFHWVIDNMYDKKRNDLLVLVHAQYVPSLPASPYPYGLAYLEEYKTSVEESDKEAKFILEEYGKECNALGVKCRLIKEAGEPGPIVIKNIVDEGCCAVFVGSRGMGAMKRAFLGSTSDFVVHHADVPITVIPSSSTE